MPSGVGLHLGNRLPVRPLAQASATERGTQLAHGAHALVPVAISLLDVAGVMLSRHDSTVAPLAR